MESPFFTEKRVYLLILVLLKYYQLEIPNSLPFPVLFFSLFCSRPMEEDVPVSQLTLQHCLFFSSFPYLCCELFCVLGTVYCLVLAFIFLSIHLNLALHITTDNFLAIHFFIVSYGEYLFLSKNKKLFDL